MVSGISPEDGETAYVLKEYYSPGTYRVKLTTTDDESRSSVSEIQIFIGDSVSDGSTGIGLVGDAGTLSIPVNDTVYFDLSAGMGAGVELDSVDWIIDGNTISETSPKYSFATPGRYDMACWALDDAGNSTLVTHSVWVYAPDTSAISGVQESVAAPPPPMIINGPMLVTRRIVFHGRRDMIINPGANVRTLHGRNGRDNRRGSGGVGLYAWSNGTLRVNGGRIAAGNGGNAGAPTGRGVRGKAGGRGGSLHFRAKNIVVNGGNFVAGDGGKGSDQTKFKAAAGTAQAYGGNGGAAGKRVRFQGSKSVSFTGPTSIHLGNGGNGGSATATGGPGNSKCKIAQDGANARARGGKGGKANKRGTITGRVSGLVNITLSGGQGGKGGDATATGGQGGSALNCKNSATGGKGGYATALAGDGGKSGYSGAAIAGAFSFKSGNGGNATANPGDGGTASAVPDPPKGAAGCPGENGVDVSARGGKGGRGTSENGRKGRKVGVGVDGTSGTSKVNGSNGGAATSTGGDGGDAIEQCMCDGGDGGKGTANGGLRGDSYARSLSGGAATKVEGNDGDATATGGTGGKGGDCCSPPGPVGGNGGKGGDASASAGPNGSNYSATGGKGGDGGDGFGPGFGGKGGKASGAGAAGTATDGADGKDGDWCFPNFLTFFCHSYIVPDGYLTPGSTIALAVCSDKDPNAHLANVDVYLMTSGELGGQPVNYEKLGDELLINQGGIEVRLNTLLDVHEPSRNWACESFTAEFNTQGGLNGVVFIGGYSGPMMIAQKEVFVDPVTMQYSATIDAPPGEKFDKVVIISEVPLGFPHWGIQGNISTP
jgi:hypothetical protein